MQHDYKRYPSFLPPSDYGKNLYIEDASGGFMPIIL
jgi:hypothetical protein